MIANLCFQTSTKTNTNSFRIEIQTTVCKIGGGFDGLLSYMLTLEPCFTLFGGVSSVSFSPRELMWLIHDITDCLVTIFGAIDYHFRYSVHTLIRFTPSFVIYCKRKAE